MAFDRVRQDIAAIFERDPAARSLPEVWLCYSGFHAILLHRVSHALWKRRLRLVARMLSQFGRFLTGIEIHPGAVIGAGFFIDHGVGVVIGETSEIGNGVTLYHGVTLGGIAPAVDSAAQARTKRHPSLADGVIIGSAAQVLGPITVGENARVGANAVVLKDVPAGATVVGIPARVARAQRADEARFESYGASRDDMSDPVVRLIDRLIDEIEGLQARIADLESRVQQTEDQMAPPWRKAEDA